MIFLATMCMLQKAFCKRKVNVDKLVVSLLFHLSLMDKWLVATGKRTVELFFPLTSRWEAAEHTYLVPISCQRYIKSNWGKGTNISYRLFFLRSIAQFLTQICQFISWTNWVNSGKFMDNFWISCQVMADMKKVYDDLIIINLFQILGKIAW